MSYATSLLMAYPPPYGPSTLLSDDLVQRTSLGALYEPSVPYRSGSHLLSDNLTYNQIGLNPTIYRSSAYSNLPSTNYANSFITDWQRDIPPPINNVREYSESISTASNTNTTSSMAHTVDEKNLNETTNVFPDYQQNYNRLLNDGDRNPQLTTIWSPTRSKISINDEKPTPTYRSVPELSAPIEQQKSPIEELRKDPTPIPSPPPPPPVLTKQESNLQKTPPLIETENRQPSVDVQAWLTENKSETPKDEKPPEEAWTIKIDQLHTNQIQREKEKVKSPHALPNLTKKIDNKPRIASFQRKNESYFDTLFDGNYFRKSTTNQNSSYQRNKSTTNSPNKSKTTVFPKNVSPRKVSQQEPPSVNRVPTTITTTSWKKLPSKQNQNDSATPRENISKDTDGRFREALHKFRSDRADQQHKEITESTAKRLSYSDYVRRSTKEGTLQNVIKPSPWSDFLDMKKGHLYALTKEEKKDLHEQSKTYAERVRYRNFTLHNGSDTARSYRRFPLFPILDHEFNSGDETSYEPANEDDDNDSDSTTKTYTKHTSRSKMTYNRNDHRKKANDRSSNTPRPTEDDDAYKSDFELSRKQKKKLFHSSARNISETEESENDKTNKQRKPRIKQRDTDDDLPTVREEKTLQSLETTRNKKR